MTKRHLLQLKLINTRLYTPDVTLKLTLLDNLQKIIQVQVK